MQFRLQAPIGFKSVIIDGMHSVEQTQLQKIVPWVILIGGIVGLLASVGLTVDRVRLAESPDIALACDINPFLSCGSVVSMPQAEAFGIPNSLLGVAGFSGLAVVGAVLLAGATLQRWFWLCLGAASTAALLFVFWLFQQTVYEIGVLCPYCIVVWIATIPVFWYVLLYLFDRQFLRLPSRLEKAFEWSKRHHMDVVAAVFLLMIGLISIQFWDAWRAFYLG